MSVNTASDDVHIPVVAFLNAIVRRIAETTAWLNVALIVVIVVQVVMRYGFNKGLVPLEELMWHLYAIAFMFGMAYAVTNDSHIRVDVVHMALPRRAQHVFEILGILLLLMPFLWIVFDHSLGWAMEAYRVNETSANPTGLPYRWIIKSVVPITMVLIFIAALARLIQEVNLLLHHGREPDDSVPGRVSMMRHLFRPQRRPGDDEGDA
jgi:TRAP-type mannitol/chloroaromatic compound transport system permease small subunit